MARKSLYNPGNSKEKSQFRETAERWRFRWAVAFQAAFPKRPTCHFAVLFSLLVLICAGCASTESGNTSNQTSTGGASPKANDFNSVMAKLGRISHLPLQRSQTPTIKSNEVPAKGATALVQAPSQSAALKESSNVTAPIPPATSAPSTSALLAPSSPMPTNQNPTEVASQVVSTSADDSGRPTTTGSESSTGIATTTPSAPTKTATLHFGWLRWAILVISAASLGAAGLFVPSIRLLPMSLITRAAPFIGELASRLVSTFRKPAAEPPRKPSQSLRAATRMLNATPQPAAPAARARSH